LPADLKLQVSEPLAAGKPLTVRGEVPARLAGARVWVTVERPLTSTAADLQPLPKDAGPERDRVMLANHERSNRFALASQDGPVKDGRFEVRLPLPEKLPWPKLRVRAYAATDRQEGLGVLMVPVRP
jgi:hypothetical protein